MHDASNAQTQEAFSGNVRNTPFELFQYDFE